MPFGAFGPCQVEKKGGDFHFSGKQKIKIKNADPRIKIHVFFAGVS